MTKQISHDVHEAAADWLIRADSEQMTASERADFTAWLRQSSDHVVAFLSVSEIYGDLSSEVLAALDLELADPGNVTSISQKRERLNNKTMFAVIGTLAACLIVCVTLLGFAEFKPQPEWAVLAQTGRSEIRTLDLIDGSVAHLNTETSLDVRFYDDRRKVELKSGDAIFTVVSDVERPFTVVTDSFQATALGTTFSVDRLENGFGVSVLEGRVALGAGESNANTIVLFAGESTVWRLNDGPPAIVKSSNIADKMSWRFGELRFSQVPLSDVVESFNRYNSVEMIIRDHDLAKQRVSGSYEMEDIDSFLAFLQLTRGVSISRQANDVVISNSAASPHSREER